MRVYPEVKYEVDYVTVGFDRIANESQGRQKRAGTTSREAMTRSTEFISGTHSIAVHLNRSFKAL